jgi:hypothetical protein
MKKFKSMYGTKTVDIHIDENSDVGWPIIEIYREPSEDRLIKDCGSAPPQESATEVQLPIGLQAYQQGTFARACG